MATIKGNSGDNVLINGGDNNVVKAGAGDDILLSFGDDNVLKGGKGDDFLFSVGEDNTLKGGKGDDVLISIGDDNTLKGGSGDDVLKSLGDHNLLKGGSGNDLLKAVGDNNTLKGGTGDDLVFAFGNYNNLYGGSGCEFIFSWGCYSCLFGGAGEDLLVALGTHNTLHGGTGNDFLKVVGHDNDLFGDDGDDTLMNSHGDNHMDGGSGIDCALYKGSKGDYTFELLPGHIVKVTDSWGGVDTLTNIEKVKFSDGTQFDIEDLVGGPLNFAPVAADDGNQGMATEDGAVVTVLASALLANDSDIDGDALSIASASLLGSEGSVSVVGGDIVFDPGADFQDLGANESRDVTIEYKIDDGNGGMATAQFTLTVKGVNDAPLAADDGNQGMAIEDGAAVTVLASALLANDSDIDGDALSIASASLLGSEGSVSVVGGDIVFDPGSDFQDLGANESRDVTIEYMIDDGNGGMATAQFTLTVKGVNDAPLAADDVAITDEDTVVNIDVLLNDSDIDGDTLSITGASVDKGSVAIVAGELVFDPGSDFDALNDGESDTATISYDVSDGNGDVDSAQVVVTVNGISDDPTPDPGDDPSVDPGDGTVGVDPGVNPGDDPSVDPGDGTVGVDPGVNPGDDPSVDPGDGTVGVDPGVNPGDDPSVDPGDGTIGVDPGDGTVVVDPGFDPSIDSGGGVVVADPGFDTGINPGDDTAVVDPGGAIGADDSISVIPDDTISVGDSVVIDDSIGVDMSGG